MVQSCLPGGASVHLQLKCGFWGARESVLHTASHVCVIVLNFVKISQTIAKVWQFNDLRDGGRLSSWIFKI